MTKVIFIQIILLCLCFKLFCQNKTEDFEITPPELKVKNSFYKNISYIDSRFDTTNMGIVQLGAFNKKVKVVPKTPFSEQLRNVFNFLIDNSAGEGELFFQLRQLNFAEITGAMSEKGYCYLRADLYSKRDKSYQKINSMDSVIYVKSMDVTRALFRKTSQLLINFIADNLTKEASEIKTYTLTDIINIDSIEKRGINVYNMAELKDGLYTTYRSFANQIPERQVTVNMQNGKISEVRIVEENKKPEKVKGKDIYAIVYNGQAFIATEYGYYPLQKRDDDFFFIGKAKVTANAGDVVAAGVFFGLMGSLMASNADATFEMKIDHLNGGFIRLKEMNNNY